MRTPALRHEERPRLSGCSLVLALTCCLLFTASCGAPGEPTPPSPPIPAAVSDLTAHQAGDGVQLVFTLPTKTVAGDRLASPPAVEVVRGLPKPDGSPDAKSFRVVYTVPDSLVQNYVAQGQVKFTGPVAPAEIRAHAGGAVLYVVRTRAAQKRASANSNVVSLRLFPVPEPIAPLTARVTEAAIELSWAAPSRMSDGEPLAAISGYRIYRGEIDPAFAEGPSKDLSQAKWKFPLALVSPSEEPSYRDTFFDFGKTYVYIVRSLVLVEGNPLESSDSEPAIVTPKDIFPPTAPQNVVGVVLPGATPDSVVVDLSWSINVETDLVGYHVYRSEQQDTKGTLVAPDLLPAPAYRDTSVEPGHRYWYSVTAVDRAGNESEPSTAVAVDVAKPSS